MLDRQESADERISTLERVLGAELAARYLDLTVTSDEWIEDAFAAQGLCNKEEFVEDVGRAWSFPDDRSNALFRTLRVNSRLRLQEKREVSRWWSWLACGFKRSC